jgi:hypothetical protein
MTKSKRNECPFCHLVHTIECPCVHSNGTAAEDLRDDLSLAVDATRVAITRVEWAAPAGRDYYIQGGEAIRQSRQQHQSRMDRLQQTAKELEEIRDHVQAVIDFRAANAEQDRLELERALP